MNWFCMCSFLVNTFNVHKWVTRMLTSVNELMLRLSSNTKKTTKYFDILLRTIFKATKHKFNKCYLISYEFFFSWIVWDCVDNRFRGSSTGRSSPNILINYSTQKLWFYIDIPDFIILVCCFIASPAAMLELWLIALVRPLLQPYIFPIFHDILRLDFRVDGLEDRKQFRMANAF